MSSELVAPLIVLAGPSGAGKTTIVERLLATTKLPIRRAITATTRAARANEVDGVDYYFWTRDEFEKKLAAGEMLEHAIVHGRDYYGTPRAEVQPHREAGTAVILVIDVQGAEQVRRTRPDGLVSIFVNPPLFDDLAERLRKRGDSEESIRRRLETAVAEAARIGEFHHELVNAEVETAARELERIIGSRFPQTGSESCSNN